MPTYLRITDIGEDNRFRPSPRVSVNHPNRDHYLLAKGDLVFARTGASVGKSYLYNPVDGPLVFAGFLVRAKPEPAKLDSVYCSYAVQSERYWRWVATMSTRSGQPGINAPEYGTFCFALPEIHEQRTIVESLSEVDDLIESLDALIAKRGAIKRAAMQQLLTGKTRLAGVNDSDDISDGYKLTEVGVIPEDWEVASLRSCLCATPDYGINAAAVPFDNETPSYLRITDIGEDNRFRPSPRVSVNHPNRDYYLLAKGDLVFARTGASVGKSYLYNPVDGPLVFAGFLVRATPEPAKLDSTYCSYTVQSERYWQWVTTMSTRSGQPGINAQEYGTFCLPLPKLHEQRAIAEALSDLDAEIATVEQRRDKTRAIKQGMMQQLLTGQVRLV